MTIEQPQRVPQRWRFGPGLLVTAAFIGPGTVVTASRAGAEFGFALIWTLLLAVSATVVLQEMASRLGLVARLGLAEAIRHTIPNPIVKRLAVTLILIAIVLGNTAYQTGNLLGAGWGMAAIVDLSPQLSAALLGAIVATAISMGASARWLRTLLVGIVLMMSALFLATACYLRPNVWEVARQAVSFSVPEGSVVTALALIGTTVVPYNLFLHAKLVQSRWSADLELGQSIRESRLDTLVAVTLGGLVTMSILITAAVAFGSASMVPSDAAQLSQQLEPLLGKFGKYLFGAGLFAAGLTSSITAPLAAGYVAAEVFNKPPMWLEKGTALSVVILGTVLAVVRGGSPRETIILAQATNGLLLPLVALFLLWVVNDQNLLEDHRNSWPLNITAAIAAVITCILGGKSLAVLF